MPSKRGAHRGGRNNSKQNWTVVDRRETSSSAESCSSLHQKRPQDPEDLNLFPTNQQNEGSTAESQHDPNSSGVDGKEEASAGKKGNQRAEGGTSNSHNDEIDEDEIVKRLEELSFSAEEPELTDALLSINKQLQEDEVLASE